jgi:16S rRNA (guanine527-N7)-methyltransferase
LIRTPDPGALSDELRSEIVHILEESQRNGFLGPAPVLFHVEHSLAFLPFVHAGPLMDLGSGGGVPGLVLAAARPPQSVVLLEGKARRAAFLREAVDALGVEATVVEGRAEECGRDARWRSRFDTVVARSFGSPAVTAECASPFLSVGGRLLVSEPPGSPDRWPGSGLALLGLEDRGVKGEGVAHLRLLEQVIPCPQRYPRAVGRPRKSPLF